jgi:hypothetical protein
MAKQGGLGDAFYLGGFDLSGSVTALDKISGTVGTLDATTISQSAHARLFGQRDGGIDITTLFNPSGAGPFAAGPAPLQTLPTADTIGTYFRGTVIGNAAACCNAKQVGFDPTRGTDGSLTLKASLQANGFGLEWGNQLTAGLRTDTTATTGTALDNAAGTSFGAQAYLQVTAFSGTSVHVLLEHSTDNVSFSTLIDFGAQSAAGASRSSVSNVTTVNRYVRATTATGTFTSITFALVIVRNLTAGVVF